MYKLKAARVRSNNGRPANSFVSSQRVHRPEVYDDVDAGAVGRFHPGIQTGVFVAMLALLWECLHHFSLPWAGETPYFEHIKCTYSHINVNL